MLPLRFYNGYMQSSGSFVYILVFGIHHNFKPPYVRGLGGYLYRYRSRNYRHLIAYGDRRGLGKPFPQGMIRR